MMNLLLKGRSLKIAFILTISVFSLQFNLNAQQTNSRLTKSAVQKISQILTTQQNSDLDRAGSVLVNLYNQYTKNPVSTTKDYRATNNFAQIYNDKVLVDITAQNGTDGLVAKLKNLGAKITGTFGRVVSAYIPISKIKEINSIKGLRYFDASIASTNVGIVTSQGDTSMHSARLRSQSGIDGSGVMVGVLSDSYNTLFGAPQDIATGDLPGKGNAQNSKPVVVVQDMPQKASDEGRGMLQIVHDVAPGAKLAFATGFNGMAGFANNILALKDSGANVIVDDISYFAEPMFQDGIIAQAVDSVESQGVPYFSSAGNSGDHSYESSWRSGPETTINGTTVTPFDFDPGPGVDIYQSFSVQAGGKINLSLQWDSPFASTYEGAKGSKNQIGILLLDSKDSIVAAAGNDNIKSGDAFQILVYQNPTGSVQNYKILIATLAGDNPGFIKYISNGATQQNLEYATHSSTIMGHPNAKGAIAVGAAFYDKTPAYGTNPPELENFSSIGPAKIFFDKYGNPVNDPRPHKPEITAPDGVNTTFFGGSDPEGDGFPNFFGTSAAAPHAAAVAALMLQQNPTLTPDQIKTELENSIIDMNDPGYDNKSGYGLIQADIAIPLPVELVSFAATNSNNNTILTWETATEKNNMGFEVDRKSGSSKSWEKIGFVPGAGNSVKNKLYSFTDDKLSSGNYSYRLKQMDYKGNYKYSKIVNVNLKVPLKYTLLQNYPNPFNPSTTIKYEIAKQSHVVLNIYDVLGNKVATLVNKDQQAGTHNVNFLTSKYNLASGMYIYKLQAGNFVSTKKLVLLK